MCRHEPGSMRAAVIPDEVTTGPKAVAGASCDALPPLRERVRDPIVVLVDRRAWIVRGSAACVIMVGALVLAGWLLNIRFLESMVAGWATMKVSTAIAFIAGGGALALIESSDAGRAGFRLGRALAALPLVVGVSSLAESLLSMDLGIDNLIVPVHAAAGSAPWPGRMSTAASLSFTFLGCALLNLRSRDATRASLAQPLTVPPLVIATLGLFGYISGVTSLYQVHPYASLALHTIFAILILSFGILGADPRIGVAAIVLSDTAGGFVARRLLCGLPPAFLVIGVMALAGESAGYYNQKFCAAVITISSMAVSMAAVSWTAFTLRRIDLTRRSAEAALERVNAETAARGERLALVQSTLAHKARSSAMGEVAAALAHELSQPLTAVGATVGAIERLLTDTTKPLDDAARERILGAVRRAANQAEHAGNIVRNIRRFVSRGEVDAKPEQLRSLIDDAVALVLSDPGSAGVKIRVSIEPLAAGVLVDRVQVQQVVVNLLRNAVEAMREQESARTIGIDATSDADMATVRVTDTGPGLDADVPARLFAAFFTTKSEGMGVGLAICRHIIEKHGGRMWFEPSDDRAADFRFTLPLSHGAPELAPVDDAAADSRDGLAKLLR